MRWVILSVTGALFIAGGTVTLDARTEEVSLYGPDFKVAGLKFTVPSRWLAETPANPVRAGQWLIPALHGLAGQDGQAAALYFGPGAGGSAKENIEAWASSMVDATGRPANPTVTTHQAGSFKVTVVTIFGTYSDPAPLPGIPPASRPSYGLLGAIVEGPQGSIYWRFIGPDTLIAADVPLFTRILDSVKPQEN